MRMKFTAYNPNTREKIKLIEYMVGDRIYGPRCYFGDDCGNFVYNPKDKKLFEEGDYYSAMEVVIAQKVYYLIGEY
ncbi:hypothetical protein [Acinetobacter pittii]|uniref:YopX protein domain-containing protein n=1 Tax=Acinetobacter pittii ANC 4050 TaxID=1217691 RepID=R8YHL8_ACIPI|nr:hypothetical protein [Acinetobacter pittii]EOQ68794.1 hypothetical protein F931_01511 [Acinetobacter pittii ANC 4050]MCG9515217.1 hypothetical protein [Acinetobacter pittii]